jgi:hypothetical protein
MTSNFILVDFENVQPAILASVAQAKFGVIVFVGASQTKVPFEMAAALQPMGADAAYVKISGNGKNALDFHIAFWIGQLSARYPSAAFHIISKDNGFDPLIAHLKERGISAARWPGISEIPQLKAPAPSKKAPKPSAAPESAPAAPIAPIPSQQPAPSKVVTCPTCRHSLTAAADAIDFVCPACKGVFRY